MRDRFHWARPLAFATELVNQDLLLRNEYLIGENRILRGHLPMRLRLADPERVTLAVHGQPSFRMTWRRGIPADFGTYSCVYSTADSHLLKATNSRMGRKFVCARASS
jgi:hypothetical protein